MSEPFHHRVDVVPVELESHPNADTLSIVRVHGYQAVVKTELWRGVDRGAYIPPDSLVPESLPSIAHIAAKVKQRHDGSYVRITVQRLRGHVSHGVLVPAPVGAEIGDDVAAELGVRHYAQSAVFEGDECPPPAGYHPVFHLDAWRRYGAQVFEPGERVIVTEKLEGEGGRAYLDADGRLHVGSRTGWKNESARRWWKAIDDHAIRELLRWSQAIGGWTIYGEVYGQVGGMEYDASGDAPGFRVFAAYDHHTQWWVNHDLRVDMCRAFDVATVPILFDGVYSRERMLELADGGSLISTKVKHREGIVIEAASLRRLGGVVDRPVLKMVSDVYMERAR